MDEYPQAALKPLKRSILKKEIEAINPKALSKMADGDLAFWQSEFEPASPQYRMAEQEWQRRLIESQLRTARFSAWLGVLGTLLGVVAGYLLGKS